MSASKRTFPLIKKMGESKYYKNCLFSVTMNFDKIIFILFFVCFYGKNFFHAAQVSNGLAVLPAGSNCIPTADGQKHPPAVGDD